MGVAVGVLLKIPWRALLAQSFTFENKIEIGGGGGGGWGANAPDAPPPHPRPPESVSV